MTPPHRPDPHHPSSHPPNLESDLIKTSHLMIQVQEMINLIELHDDYAAALMLHATLKKLLQHTDRVIVRLQSP